MTQIYFNFMAIQDLDKPKPATFTKFLDRDTMLEKNIYYRKVISKLILDISAIFYNTLFKIVTYSVFNQGN
jgi:hypothetical protein